ncbi:putative haloacid dehalogenase (HAD)-like hydrolase [Advenella mimigardefordensis DPN7]|uniref:Putative haloacid dehalogenase (HAD)-like hydrolase n=1 Tax=Advenella mimigardefordensis (strain DSM 17166 / LMG 22922 / DPN7) TaxID=1247726 RepID=W0PBN2_ADVMD|nr:HAD-IA family hydrolase [Advenella mimigardefordensis]AHG62820.1 putative haloacid dehalogenase (HAD)-like hydrolase [Advenella mimigardefordensis DPN7]
MKSLPYQLLAFDFDGTLADTLPWFDTVLASVAQKYGFRNPAQDEKDQLRHRDVRQILSTLDIPFWKAPAILMEFRQRMQEASPDVHLFAGIEQTLAALKQAGYQIAVLSSNSEINVRRTLGCAAEYIDQYRCGSDLFGKASRLKTLYRQTGCTPDTCLLIGDEIRDIDAARESGCDAASVSWGYNHPDVLAAKEPQYLFGTPDDILAQLLPA